MNTARMEAFSDAVIAIVMTIMVLEMKVPHGHDLAAVASLLPVWLSYVLSFVYVGIYWNNHHHMLHVAKRVDGSALWANLHLLFWLSLIPFATGWLAETACAPWPTALYGVVLLASGVAYMGLERAIVLADGEGSLLRRAVGDDPKAKATAAVCLAAIVLASVSPWLSVALYCMVAMTWIVPDRRIERLTHE